MLETMKLMEYPPPLTITLHKDGKQVGEFNFSGPQMTFTGDADTSAQVFIEECARIFAKRLDDERKAEREACAKLCEWLPIGTGLQGKTCAEAIRGGDTFGGKMAQAFDR